MPDWSIMAILFGGMFVIAAVYIIRMLRQG